MGCTGEKTYEEAVKSEINRYLNGFNLLSSTKKEITTYINQDLKKKSVALENYQYLYREEDVKQTVEEYKILLSFLFSFFFALLPLLSLSLFSFSFLFYLLGKV